MYNLFSFFFPLPPPFSLPGSLIIPMDLLGSRLLPELLVLYGGGLWMVG